MPGCIFIASGVDFDVEAFMADSPWREFAECHRKGEPRRLVRGVHEDSGLLIGVSDEDESDLHVQMRDAMEFMQQERGELERLAGFPGVERSEFRIGLLWRREVLSQHYTLSPEFAALAGELGIHVTLCVYQVSD